MKIILVAVFLASCLLFQLAECKSKQSSSTNSAKKEGGGDNGRFATIIEKSYMNLIPLSDSNFSKFIVERPREYHAVLLFTATAPQYQCSVCTSTKKDYAKAASYYREKYDLSSTAPENRIAFFILEVDSARSIFNDMGLETVPRIYSLPPTKSNSPKMKMGEFEIEVRKLIEGIGSFLGELGSRTGVKIDVTMSPLPILCVLLIVAYCVALLAAAASTEPTKAIFWYQSPSLWVVVSLLVFGVGVSGSLFCVIRAAPLYGAGGRNGVRIFAGQGRDQYLIEGIIIALMTVGCGMAGMLVYYGTKVPLGPVVRHVIVIAAMSAFAVLCMEIGDAYIDKTRWYSIKETLDPSLWTFLTSGVKKTSGLLKRLVRLSEYWLFEYKSWEGFTKKFKALIVDYVERVAKDVLTYGSISRTT